MSKASYHLDDQSFVWRQYAALQNQGVSHTQIIHRLTSSIGPEVENALGFLGMPPDQKDAAKSNQNLPQTQPTLTGILKLASDLGANIPVTLTQLEGLSRRTQAFATVWWRGFTSFFLYALTLLILATIVVVIFQSWVLPEFSDFLLSLNYASANSVTTAIIHRHWLLYVPIITGYLLLFVTALFFLFLRRHTRNMRALPTWIKWVPLCLGTYRAFNAAIALNIAQILVAAGTQAEKTLSTTFALFGIRWESSTHTVKAHMPVRTPIEYLRLSQQLGTLETEIAVQADRQWFLLEDIALRMRDKVTLMLRIVLYVLVALIVYLLYQPIIHLGGGI